MKPFPINIKHLSFASLSNFLEDREDLMSREFPIIRHSLRNSSPTLLRAKDCRGYTGYEKFYVSSLASYHRLTILCLCGELCFKWL